MMALWLRVTLVGYHRNPGGVARFRELLRVADDPGMPGTPEVTSDRSTRVVLFALDWADVEDAWSYPPNFPQDTCNGDYQYRLGFARAAAWLAGRTAAALDE